ncbi:MAG: hypothetical protein GTO18_13875 [Anaerolineales bacterium]|nr:hypothetical protein [Anaerolineales bacterium]
MGRGARRAGRRRGRRRARRRTHRRMRRRMRRRMIIGGMVVLGVGYGAYKLTQSQVDQIESHMGKSAEDLSEEELEAAMDDLNIESQEVTDSDIAQLEAAEAAESGTASQPAAAPAQAGSEDYLDELEKLAELRDKGIITEQEFEAKKKELLGL